MKTCSKCGEEKDRSLFYNRAKSSDKLSNHCKACSDQYTKSWENENKTQRQEYYRRNNLKKNFGITLEQYNDLLEKQNYSCALCGKHKDEEKKNLAVDHNHITREIRGLLCSGCNYRIIGRHRDGDLLRRMADYVDQGTGWFVPVKKRPKKRKPVR